MAKQNNRISRLVLKFLRWILLKFIVQYQWPPRHFYVKSQSKKPVFLCFFCFKCSAGLNIASESDIRLRSESKDFQSHI